MLFSSHWTSTPNVGNPAVCQEILLQEGPILGHCLTASSWSWTLTSLVCQSLSPFLQGVNGVNQLLCCHWIFRSFTHHILRKSLTVSRLGTCSLTPEQCSIWQSGQVRWWIGTGPALGHFSWSVSLNAHSRFRTAPKTRCFLFLIWAIVNFLFFHVDWCLEIFLKPSQCSSSLLHGKLVPLAIRSLAAFRSFFSVWAGWMNVRSSTCSKQCCIHTPMIQTRILRYHLVNSNSQQYDVFFAGPQIRIQAGRLVQLHFWTISSE